MQNIQGVRQNCYLLFLSWPKFPDFCLLVHVICIYSIDIKLQEDPPSNSKFCLSIDIDMERQNIEVDGGSSCSFMSMEEMQAVILTRQDQILMSFWTFGNNQPLTRQWTSWDTRKCKGFLWTPCAWEVCRKWENEEGSKRGRKVLEVQISCCIELCASFILMAIALSCRSAPAH